MTTIVKKILLTNIYTFITDREDEISDKIGCMGALNSVKIVSLRQLEVSFLRFYARNALTII